LLILKITTKRKAFWIKIIFIFVKIAELIIFCALKFFSKTTILFVAKKANIKRYQSTYIHNKY